MNSLSKEKRNQLVLAVLVTGGVLCGLWFGVIRFQKAKVQQFAESKLAAAQKLDQVKQAIETAEVVEVRLGESTQRLTKIEATMASGDLYSWTINTLRAFKLGY